MGKHQIVSQALFKTLLPALLCLSLSAVASAQSQDTDIRPNADQLTGQEIKKVFATATMDGAYNFGRNEKAQSFYKEQHNPDGTLLYEEGYPIYVVQSEYDDLIDVYNETRKDLEKAARDIAAKELTQVERRELREKKRRLESDLEDSKIDIRAFERVQGWPKANLPAPEYGKKT